MKTYDWIVVGAGFTGAALAYELVKKGFSVLLLEQDTNFHNATHYSYGGLAFWSGTTPVTRQLCDEGIARYQILSQELNANIELRELDLLLTIPTDTDPKIAAASYAHFATPPKLLSVDEACEMEPLLNREAIAGALTVKHGHINPQKTVQAYIQAFLRAGGEMEFTQVQNLLTGVQTTTTTYHSANVVVCAGGFSRDLLKASGIPIKVYFTHAEMIETPPVEINLRTLVMPANLQRFQLEAESSKVDEVWNEPGNEPVAPILDAGAIQFLDGSLRLGQISRIITNPSAEVDSKKSERWLRQSIGEILPELANLPGTWHHCLVAFSSDRLPVIGTIPGYQGIYIFSGFSNPLVIVPPLAQRFANWVSGQEDEIISQWCSSVLIGGIS
ncbi:NAD(P)/FAD-dependent oxidoreductase [Chlorogloeopsis fritschii PCC 9212]|uniref:Putative D-amino acid oxidase n=1 Tax=Chlorogloeopsis fritschii PCC 6912 TaxID=211165 RepID=A0A433N755_CHLFR|nr:FAD-binding oxidoreductase [Chlorogloeopsis fritschii]RUR77454.1 putative D-amino acid oxidase [Chlorogloeopsis fritschii PCC 6912]